MTRHVLMTGATGAMGPYAAAQILAGRVEKFSFLMRGEEIDSRFSQWLREFQSLVKSPLSDRIAPVRGDITTPGLGLNRADASSLHDVDIILHAAAETRFRASPQLLHQVNVNGTTHLLAFARMLPHLKHLVLCSTTCVAGTRRGRIAEIAHPEPAEFINVYEQSKWQAENLALASNLPVRIVRLSTAIGRRADGSFRKPGAFHHALQWIYRGLVPMVPADPQARVDFISLDKAAMGLAAAVAQPLSQPEIWQIAAGEEAASAADLTGFITAQFRARSRPWRTGQIAAPLLTDGPSFQRFRDMIQTSGDPLFQQVLDSVNSFLPGLLHPKIYETSRATAACGPMSENWRDLLAAVIDHGCATAWGRIKSEEALLV